MLLVVDFESPYGNHGDVVVTHPQEVAAWFIQAVGRSNPGCDQHVMGGGR